MGLLVPLSSAFALSRLPAVQVIAQVSVSTSRWRRTVPPFLLDGVGLRIDGVVCLTVKGSFTLCWKRFLGGSGVIAVEIDE
jgi:hypothetical protein